MSQERLQAAAKAMADHNGWTSYTDAQKALAAADAVMFSHEAIERVARAMAADEGWTQIDWEMTPTRYNPWPARARAVVAALKGEQ